MWNDLNTSWLRYHIQQIASWIENHDSAVAIAIGNDDFACSGHSNWCRLAEMVAILTRHETLAQYEFWLCRATLELFNNTNFCCYYLKLHHWTKPFFAIFLKTPNQIQTKIPFFIFWVFFIVVTIIKSKNKIRKILKNLQKNNRNFFSSFETVIIFENINFCY